MPQLTLRSALTGMVLGGVLWLTNLYVGIQDRLDPRAWASPRSSSPSRRSSCSPAIGLGNDFTILENNAMQSIATAAGYMTVAADLLAGRLHDGDQAVIPMVAGDPAGSVCISILGVLFAFPLKTRFINDEQHPVPGGPRRRHGDGHPAHRAARPGLFKAKVLGVAARRVSALHPAHPLREGHARQLRLPVRPAGVLDGWSTSSGPAQASPASCSARPDRPARLVHRDVGTGGLMGIKTGVSLLLGAVINYLVLAPWMIAGDQPGRSSRARRLPRASPSGRCGAAWP